MELLREENKQLKLHIVELEAKLEKYENPKNSGNSSVPPSQDPFRKTKSLRGKSKFRPGGQKGRKGILQNILILLVVGLFFFQRTGALENIGIIGNGLHPNTD